MIDSSSQASDQATDVLETFTEYQAASAGDAQELFRKDGVMGSAPILVLFTVSVACATAAIAAGSYALWLTRQKAARKTLTDVQDLLKVCQERMQQMEADLNHLPSGLGPATAR